MGYHHALKSTEAISKAVQRLPDHLRHSFYKYTQIHIEPSKSLSLLQFEKWLETTVHQYFTPIANIHYIQQVAGQESCKFKQGFSQEFTRNNHLQSDSSSNSTIKCWLCSVAHKLPSCSKFWSKSLADKKKVVETYKLCWNCLAKGHRIKQCPSKVTSRVDSCRKRHHTLLHETKKVVANQSIAEEEFAENTSIQSTVIQTKTYL